MHDVNVGRPIPLPAAPAGGGPTRRRLRDRTGLVIEIGEFRPPHWEGILRLHR